MAERQVTVAATMDHHSKLIDDLGGYAALAAALDIRNPSTVAHWHRRGIPAARWVAVSHLARKRKLAAVTVEWLARTSPQATPRLTPPKPMSASAG